MSYDVDAIIAARDIVLCSVAGTISIALAMILLHQMLGWPSMVGLAVLLICLPIPMLFARRISAVQTQIMRATENRISKIAECLPAIRTIKYFAWEKAISGRINEARQHEQVVMWKRSFYTIAIIMSADLSPLLSILVMFTCYVLATGKPLTSAIAFTSLTLVEIIRSQFILMSSVVSRGSQAKASLRRLDGYFESSVKVQRHCTGPPSFKDATLSRSQWSQFKLTKLSVQFAEKGLNVVTGPSGSGKTSLLLSLLGETILESGEVKCPLDVAYASQTAWLQHDTIRNNVVFNSVFEQARYDSVISACCLLQDFEQLPNGDLTDIGENGIVLSGGQRQRVALARAIYSTASLILLDDVFSALDITTTVHVYNHCFCSGLLGDRTTIIVTQVPWIAEEADFLIRLEGGVIAVAEKRQHNVRVAVTASRAMSCNEIGLLYDSGYSTPIGQNLREDDVLAPGRKPLVISGSNKIKAKSLRKSGLRVPLSTQSPC